MIILHSGQPPPFLGKLSTLAALYTRTHTKSVMKVYVCASTFRKYSNIRFVQNQLNLLSCGTAHVSDGVREGAGVGECLLTVCVLSIHVWRTYALDRSTRIVCRRHNRVIDNKTYGFLLLLLWGGGRSCVIGDDVMTVWMMRRSAPGCQHLQNGEHVIRIRNTHTRARARNRRKMLIADISRLLACERNIARHLYRVSAQAIQFVSVYKNATRLGAEWIKTNRRMAQREWDINAAEGEYWGIQNKTSDIKYNVWSWMRCEIPRKDEFIDMNEFEQCLNRAKFKKIEKLLVEFVRNVCLASIQP